MNGIVTRQFLRRRFWIATLVGLVTLALSAQVIVLAMGAQVDRGNYLAAFHRLNNAATRLELELVRLSQLDEGAMADRAGVRAAFADALTEFRAIGISEAGDLVASGPHLPDGGLDAQLARLAAELGIDAVRAAKQNGVYPVAMPDALAEIWGADRSGATGREIAPLETSISRMLVMSAPLVRGRGGFNTADRQRAHEIGAIAAVQIRPMMNRLAEIPGSWADRPGGAAIFCLLALSGFGVIAGGVIFFAIYRPLERVVMANQAGLLSEHEKALAAHQAKRDFLSMISHELRTPMNGVLGFASLLAASDLKPGQHRQVELIQSSGKTLLSLVDDLLDFSKMEAGSQEIEDENFSIRDVIDDVVTLQRGGAAAKGLEMSVHLDARLPECSRGDGNRLRQILINLVGNAIKFTDEGAIGIEAREVSMSPDPQGGCEMEFAIRDTGIGIPLEKTDLIFERFTQLDTGVGRKRGGTGLGLAICKQLVEKMGGGIWVESMPDAGSTFFVRLPLAAASPPVAGVEATPGNVGEGFDSDSPLIGETQSKALEKRITKLRVAI
jgi:signal transduction histidine kinase